MHGRIISTKPGSGMACGDGVICSCGLETEPLYPLGTPTQGQFFIDLEMRSHVAPLGTIVASCLLQVVSSLGKMLTAFPLSSLFFCLATNCVLKNKVVDTDLRPTNSASHDQAIDAVNAESTLQQNPKW
jgi:hypothetical protein